MSQLERKNQSNSSQVSCRSNQPLCSGKLQSSRSYVAGDVFLGKFTSVKNDFSLVDAFDAGTSYPEGEFQNQNHWNDVKRDEVKKFRFVVCTLALIALALSVMSRALLYIAIVEMTHQPIIPAEPAAPHELDRDVSTLDSGQESVSRLVKSIEFANDNVDDGSDHNQKIVSVFTVNDSDDENPEAGLHFSWSVKETNFLLSAFFIGYAPAMFFSGGVAEKYGSMPLLAMCVLGSAMINALTPFLAAFSYISLVASRVSLGLLQGPLVPACYDIFNRWLTVTEMNFMAPLIKVSMAVGTLAGTVLPGLVAHAGHEWTQNFYIGGLVCLVWAMLWFPLATSTPQTNRWIEEGELQRIFRKKSTVLAVIKVDSTKSRVDARSPEKKSAEKVSIPWMSIVLSPSVLALTFVKFTYNLGMDFVAIMSPIYLSQIHQATTETVALLASTGCIMQMLLISLVGGLATYVVRNETFGLTKTKWRKLFQGTSNFGVAFIYLLVPLVSPGNFVLVAGLLMMIYFFWMFGAGGETMVPYDLSPKYPATIMGFAHSLSILSGFVLPSVCSMILGDDKSVPARWNTLFMLISGASLLGGLVFVLVIKAKPFLPSERAKYDEARKEPLPNGSISK